MNLSGPFRSWLCTTWLATCPLVCGDLLVADETTADASDPAAIEFFEKQVRPLLVARCHECHGTEDPKGSLRLDSRAGVWPGGDTGRAVVPGKPEESLLVDAIRYGDTYQMPPKSQLPAEEIATLVDWVRRGAPWGREPDGTAEPASDAAGGFDLAQRAGHWSLRPIVDAAPPKVARTDWIRTPVDRFILARLSEAGMQPAPAAEKRALLRRVTYDLIGLPPTPAEIADFLADDAPGAYRRVVERLLASPHYGERWARHWLDLVRYAETYGHEFDYNIPNAYRYRDYVIRALNDDVPYDQFVVEHIAGDLLDEPRRHPRTGHNESVLGTGCLLFGEAKHSPVDTRQDEADRMDNQIDVLAKTFLGLTVSCARCHDHKFDAISTKDYYALAGYLQSSRYQQAFIDAPRKWTAARTAAQQLSTKRRAAVAAFARDGLVTRLEQLAGALQNNHSGAAAEAWTKYLQTTARTRRDDPMHAWSVLTAPTEGAEPPDFAVRRAQLVAQWQAEGQSLSDDQAQGRADEANHSPTVWVDFRGTDYGTWSTSGPAFGDRPAAPLESPALQAGDATNGRLLARGAAHSGMVSPKLQGAPRSPTFEITRPKIFYRLHGTGGKVRLILNGLQLIKNPIYGGLEFGPGENDTTPYWHTQDVSKWIGQRAYIEVLDDGDGYIALEQVAFGDAAPPASRPNRLVAAMLADASLDSPAKLADAYQALLARVVDDWVANPLRAASDQADQAAIVCWLLEGRWLDESALAPALAKLRSRLAELDRQQTKLDATIPRPQMALAIADGTGENEHLFIRGNHKTLGDEVPRRFLEVLGGTQVAAPENGSGRMELARQLVATDNPLVARVIVNRLWHHHFGTGLVRTVDDFGAMGQPPTHPKLLDYLASELVRQGWSLKRMHRLMVLSNTYRMSSRAEPEVEAADPLNALCHRMPVRRLEAETIRDAVLAVSGRLDRTMYGPSVMPYLTPFMSGRGRPTKSGPLDGAGRRSIYLAVRRNFLSPMLLAFDYPTPFTTIGRRGVSNVPAQALAMMNNPFVVSEAERWGQKMAAVTSRPVADRVRLMYEAALGRPPEAGEMQSALRFFAGSPQAAVAEGNAVVNVALTGGDSAAADPQAWADFAHVLFNLKEFIFVP